MIKNYFEKSKLGNKYQIKIIVYQAKIRGDIGLSDLSDKTKLDFFLAVAVSLLQHGCTSGTLTKRLEKMLDGNWARILRALLDNSWKQYPTKHQLYGYLPLISRIIQVQRMRQPGFCWRSKDKFISEILLWTLSYGHTRVG